jgi:hypothetical protein
MLKLIKAASGHVMRFAIRLLSCSIPGIEPPMAVSTAILTANSAMSLRIQDLTAIGKSCFSRYSSILDPQLAVDLLDAKPHGVEADHQPLGALGSKMHGIAIAGIGFTLRRNARRGA